MPTLNVTEAGKRPSKHLRLKKRMRRINRRIKINVFVDTSRACIIRLFRTQLEPDQALLGVGACMASLQYRKRYGGHLYWCCRITAAWRERFEDRYWSLDPLPADWNGRLVLPQRDFRGRDRHDHHRTLGRNHRAYLYGSYLAFHTPDRKLLVRGSARVAVHLYTVARGGGILPP